MIKLNELQNIYDQKFYTAGSNYNYRSAKLILPILFKYYKPESVIDIGCGIGSWLRAMLEFYISNIHGVDCNKVDEEYLLVPRKYIEIDNLESHINYSNKKYDLAISVEVAEHLDNSSSENFIKMLTSYSNVILFSAGIPYQSGVNHINCQSPDFWYKIFNSLGYVCFDFRHELMNMWENVTPPYAQNLLLYVHKDMAYKFQAFELTNRPLFYYHPHYVNDIIIEYDNKIKDNINNNISIMEDIRLNTNWFNLLTIFNIPFLCISNNSSYFRITILGIKLTFRVNEESVNKIAWWIPVKKWRDNFRSRFKMRPDQTRPDQTRPDQTRPNLFYTYFYLYNNTKNKKLQPMLQYSIAA
ncbi:methyltransferase domain-containing protein [Brachyspira pilosicoli]|uniref:methyltransferase domain-containing protein n=1 Tax=Brachyspira pilosicoli TaxID=52584 RepID=UPI0025426B7F|nr:methyltransferase domain-containing protein [Brachyspira pilosicoli]WIH87730.1 class I SAM-dependent methyltransferase [Brachyspira pilosicoli]